jgi:O-acetyl-ADP-ribose deacetylase (regulator of RNase III)
MVTEVVGDLLKADTDALVNPVNCVGVMGKGLALQFKREHPANFEAYAAACHRGEVQPGVMLVFRTDTGYIINFPTKRHWRSRSKIADIESGLTALITTITELKIASIAIPPLGAGHGGLPWAQVEPLIRTAFSGLPDVAVSLYSPQGYIASQMAT